MHLRASNKSSSLKILQGYSNCHKKYIFPENYNDESDEQGE